MELGVALAPAVAPDLHIHLHTSISAESELSGERVPLLSIGQLLGTSPSRRRGRACLSARRCSCLGDRGASWLPVLADRR